MNSLRRLDTEIVRRQLSRSRAEAQQLILNGEVVLNGVVTIKPARQVRETDSIVVMEQRHRWVSRGALKLLSALSVVEPEGFTLHDHVVLDAGASTGGFTEVCLSKGATRVFAVDVGYGQIAWSLRTDPRVDVIERFNIRYLDSSHLEALPTRVVADLSFISLRTVLPALSSSTAPDCQMLLMVKPQFEVGKSDVGNGVVSSPELRAQAVEQVVASAQECGLGLRCVVASDTPGPEGNVEYFVWLDKSAKSVDADTVRHLIEVAVKEGPS